jgi:hypothetical protein
MGIFISFFSDILPKKTSIVLANGRTKHMETYRQEGDGFQICRCKGQEIQIIMKPFFAMHCKKEKEI